MLESLVDADVVVAPAEVACRAGLHACSGRAGDGIDRDVTGEHQVLGQGEQAELDAGGEAARIGHVAALADGAPVEFRQAVDEVMVIGLDAVVHREVDDAQLLGHVVAFHEFARVAVCRAEEEAVDVVQAQFVGKGQVGFAIQTFMHLGNLVPGVAVAVYEHDFRIGMVDEQADKFAGRIAGSADDSYFYHIGQLSWGTTSHMIMYTTTPQNAVKRVSSA